MNWFSSNAVIQSFKFLFYSCGKKKKKLSRWLKASKEKQLRIKQVGTQLRIEKKLFSFFERRVVTQSEGPKTPFPFGVSTLRKADTVLNKNTNVIFLHVGLKSESCKRCEGIRLLLIIRLDFCHNKAPRRFWFSFIFSIPNNHPWRTQKSLSQMRFHRVDGVSQRFNCN